MNAYQYDAFIIYNDHDIDWVYDKLLPALHDAGIRTCINKEDFTPGIPIVTNIESAITQSRKTLLVMTPAWLASGWNQFETILLQSQDLFRNLPMRTIPLLLEPCDLPARISMLHALDFTPASRLSFEGAIQQLIKTIRTQPAKATANAAQPPKATKAKDAVQIYTSDPCNSAYWKPGEILPINDKEYLLYEPIEASQTDTSIFLRRQARAQELKTGEYAWIKQIVGRSQLAPARLQLDALQQENALLNSLSAPGGFPRSLGIHNTDHCVTVVYAYPAGETWRQRFGPRNHHPLDPFTAQVLLQGVPSLCELLTKLHKRQCSHRALTPDTILALKGQSQRVVLRDLGLATQSPRYGEVLDEYQAPEQRRLDVMSGERITLPGAHTDIYRLAAILYHILTGRLPESPIGIIPVSQWNNTLPTTLDQVLLKALASRADARWPTIGSFSIAVSQVIRDWKLMR